MEDTNQANLARLCRASFQANFQIHQSVHTLNFRLFTRTNLSMKKNKAKKSY